MFKALFAQYDYSYDAPLYTDTSTSDAAFFTGAMLFFLVLVLALIVPTLIGLWKVFVKAGKPGWAAIVPFYNMWVWVEIVGRPQSWFWIYLGLALFSSIPFLGLFASVGLLVFAIILSIDLAKSFRKDAGMGVLIALLPFIGLPILGFGAAKYDGPSVKQQTVAEPPYPTHKSATSAAAPKATKSSAAADKNDGSDES